MTTSTPPPSTPSTPSSSSSSKVSTSEPLMASLSRLSQSTSGPSIASHDSSSGTYPSRTMRYVNRGSKELWRRSGLASLWSIEDSPMAGPQKSSSPSKGKSRSTLDVSSILYPTLRSHPAPTPNPILVLSLSQISAVSPLITNDELFDVLVRRLEPWVGEEGEGGYVLTVLAADDRRSGERKWPGVGWWIWKWKRIPRKYRKNLKRLYIIHPSLFTRTLLPLFLPLISPKSYPKLHPLSSLIALYHTYNVPLSGIALPLAVLHEESRSLRDRPNTIPTRRNRRQSSPHHSEPSWSGTITSTISAASSYLPFGRYDVPGIESGSGYWNRSLEEILQDSSGRVPQLLVHMREAILGGCTGTEGVFRRTSNSILLDPIVALLDLPISDQPTLPWIDIALEDPLLPPKILLRFLGELEDPLISKDLYPLIRECTNQEKISDVLLPALNSGQRLILSYVVQLLHNLSVHETKTKMSPLALAIVVAPTLINGADAIEDAEMCLPQGKKLPTSMGGKDRGGRGGTLVGSLEIWIRDWEIISGDERRGTAGNAPFAASASDRPKHGLLGESTKAKGPSSLSDVFKQ